MDSDFLFQIAPSPWLLAPCSRFFQAASVKRVAALPFGQLSSRPLPLRAQAQGWQTHDCREREDQGSEEKRLRATVRRAASLEEALEELMGTEAQQTGTVFHTINSDTESEENKEST